MIIAEGIEGKVSKDRDLASTQEQQQSQSKAAQQRNNLEKLI